MKPLTSKLEKAHDCRVCRSRTFELLCIRPYFINATSHTRMPKRPTLALQRLWQLYSSRTWLDIRGALLFSSSGSRTAYDVRPSFSTPTTTTCLIRTPSRAPTLSFAVTPSSRSSLHTRAHVERTSQDRRTTSAYPPPFARRLCSSEASSTLVRMATDRDILPPEYVQVSQSIV